MDTTIQDFQILLTFLISTIVYYVPCVIGSVISGYIKQHKDPKVTFTLKMCVIYSIIPTMILTSLNYYLDKYVDNRTEVIFGIAFLCGLVASELSECFISLKRITKSIINIRKIFNGINKLTDDKVINAVLKEITEKSEDNDDTEDKK